MFERFTPTARDAVVNAQTAATRIGARSVDSRHLVVALLNTPEVINALTTMSVDVKEASAALADDVNEASVDAEALSAIGIDLAEVTRRAENVFGPGALTTSRNPKKHIPFNRDAKKTLELALREAIWLHDRTICEHHLMLGILRAECAGRRLLARHLDVTALRTTLIAPDSASA